MSDLNDSGELENELIKRNREIAKVKDEKLKLQKQIEDMHMRNDELLEKISVLDSQVTVWKSKSTELEATVESQNASLEARSAEMEELRVNHAKEVEGVRNGAEASEQLSVMLERLQQEVDEERKAHGNTKSALEQSEQAARDSLKKLADNWQKLKDMEDEKERLRETLVRQREEENAKRVEAEHGQLTAHEEVDSIRSELQRHEALSQDLEAQVREAEEALETCRTELADAKSEIAEHSTLVERLQEERDEAVRKFDGVASANHVQEDEQKRQQEQIRKVNQQVAALEGRLESQRLVLEQTQEALQNSQASEEALKAELEEKQKALLAAEKQAEEMLKEAQERAKQERNDLESRNQAGHEAEIAEVKAKARSEVDAANRATAEVQEQVRSLENKLASAKADHEEAVNSGERQGETLRAQAADLRQRIADGEEKLLESQKEVDKLKGELQEKALEAEKVAVDNRLDIEKLQQTIEVERQSRISQDQVSESKLEEKDAMLQHRAANVERLEQDLEDAKKKCAGLEEEVTKVREAGEEKARQLGVRNAKLEGEVRNRTERLTEMESRLDAQRSYLEQLNDTVQKVHSEKDGLMETKGALEAQLKLELTHKESVSALLKQQQEDEVRQRQELEEQLAAERKAHREAIEEAGRSYNDEIKVTSERLTTVEAELKTSQQQCADLLRLKGDLQQEIAQYKEQMSMFDVRGAEYRAENEKMSVELDQLRQSKASMEQDISRAAEDVRLSSAKIEELSTQLKESQQQQATQREEFSTKLQKLNELLDSERELHSATEKSLADSRREGEEQTGQQDAERRRWESKVQQVQAMADDYQGKATEAELKIRRLEREAQDAENRVKQLQEQMATHREKSDAMEKDHRDADASSRAELKRLQLEVDELKANLAQQNTVNTAKVASLERQIDSEASVARAAGMAREAAENQLRRHEDERSSLRERAAMAVEELSTRQVEFAIEKRKISGALEESRRTLRSTLGAPTPAAATSIDASKVQSLEKHLAEERRKTIEQAVALQRAERKVAQLEDAKKKSEELRSASAQQARDAERRVTNLTEDLRKSRLSQATNDLRAEEAREIAAMSAAEMHTVRYEARYELTKLRGALEELRWCATSRAASGR